MAQSQRNLGFAIGGSSIFAATVYYLSRPAPQKTLAQQRQEVAEGKRREGLSGAGVGGNAATGGHELSARMERPREPATMPPEDLPSGGVGGGYGGGNSNARAIEISSKKIPQSGDRDVNVSATLQGVFGTGGKTAGTGTDPDLKNTRAASNYDGTPTKRDSTHHDRWPPAVPRPDDDARKKHSGQG